jgi:hypothetical protein
VDGGTFTDLNLQDGIDRCREVVEDDRDIIVDVVMCNSDPVKINDLPNHSFFRPYHIWKRQSEFKDFYSAMNDVMEVVKANPYVNYRYVISASEKLPGGPVPIIVKIEDIQKMYDIGYKDAVKAIKGEEVFKEYKDMI